MTIGELTTHLRALARTSPLGKETEIRLDTPNGLCEFRDFEVQVDLHSSDDVCAVLTAEPAAFELASDEASAARDYREAHEE